MAIIFKLNKCDLRQFFCFAGDGSHTAVKLRKNVLFQLF